MIKFYKLYIYSLTVIPLTLSGSPLKYITDEQKAYAYNIVNSISKFSHTKNIHISLSEDHKHKVHVQNALNILSENRDTDIGDDFMDFFTGLSNPNLKFKKITYGDYLLELTPGQNESAKFFRFKMTNDDN